MILWKDFILDDFIGPVLATEGPRQVCRNEGWDCASVMDDARAEMAQGCASFQETRQRQRPARMVGMSGLDAAPSGTEAGRSNPSALRQGGKR